MSSEHLDNTIQPQHLGAQSAYIDPVEYLLGAPMGLLPAELKKLLTDGGECVVRLECDFSVSGSAVSDAQFAAEALAKVFSVRESLDEPTPTTGVAFTLEPGNSARQKAMDLKVNPDGSIYRYSADDVVGYFLPASLNEAQVWQSLAEHPPQPRNYEP